MKKILILLFFSIIGTIVYIRVSEVVPVFKDKMKYSFKIDRKIVKKLDELIDEINLGEIVTKNRMEDIDQVINDNFKAKLIFNLNENKTIAEIEKINDPTDEEINRLVEMKELFFNIFPSEWTKDVVEFRGFVNNPSIGGFISPVEGNSHIQYVAVNVEEGIFRTRKGKLYFLIHEFAHVFSLNSKQYDYNCKLTKIECLHKNSYLNEYFEMFWKNNFSEKWYENEDKKRLIFEKFYNLNKDVFVTSYAANNLFEDFAETFVFFVLNKFPREDTVKASKIKYFYSKPEFLKLKAEILENIMREIYFLNAK